LLSGEADRFDSYLEVHAGAGGTESQDWAEMLLRMYTRWAEKHGFKIEYLEETQGEEAGIKSATVQISGHNAYGWLKTEGACTGWCGFRRLIPTAAAHLVLQRRGLSGGRRQHQDRHQGVGRAHRHHAFGRRRRPARQQDRIRRAADAHSDRRRGGLPGRTFQHKNRAQAWTCCGPALRDRTEEARGAGRRDQAAKTEIGWGHQIRSYVLQPYQMVKDLRTGVQTSDTSGVLDGDLDEFMAATLAQRAFGASPGAVEDVD